MLNFYDRLGEIPKSKYEEMREAWKSLAFKNDNVARNRFNAVVRGRKRMYMEEALFFCNHLHCTIQQLCDPDFSLAESLRDNASFELAVIDKSYGMTA